MEPLIKIEHVQFSYPSEEENRKPVEVLKDISLEFQHGELVAVLGHNGSGKSTLAKLMNAVLLPTEGKVTVSGIDTKEEEKRLDKFHELTEHKFDDEEIYRLMIKYKDDDDAILNELKEQLKEEKRGEGAWEEVGKRNYIFYNYFIN